jgi:hypothetical protein
MYPSSTFTRPFHLFPSIPIPSLSFLSYQAKAINQSPLLSIHIHKLISLSHTHTHTTTQQNTHTQSASAFIPAAKLAQPAVAAVGRKAATTMKLDLPAIAAGFAPAALAAPAFAADQIMTAIPSTTVSLEVRRIILVL